jgi:hypothetical protein
LAAGDSRYASLTGAGAAVLLASIHDLSAAIFIDELARILEGALLGYKPKKNLEASERAAKVMSSDVLDEMTRSLRPDSQYSTIS